MYHYAAAPPSVAAFGRAACMINPAGGMSHFKSGCFYSVLAGVCVYVAVVMAVEAVIAVVAAPSVTAGPAGVAALYVATLISAITAISIIVMKYFETGGKRNEDLDCQPQQEEDK